MNSKFLFGDCKKLIKSVADESIDLIITDPPYVGVVKKGWDQEEEVTQELIEDLFRVMKPSASIYIWCGIGEKSSSLMRWWPMFNQQFYFKDLITWKKKRGLGMRKGWLYAREEVMWFVKDNKKFVWNKEHQYSDEPQGDGWGFNKGYKKYKPFKRIPNVWSDVPEMMSRRKTKHATPKPKKALERIINCHTKEGDLILDPFAGSGSTLMAAKNLKRNYIGFENDQEIFDDTIKTLEIK